ncbi:MAG: DUF1552 domain-containing protein [Myxococcales bacterium]
MSEPSRSALASRRSFLKALGASAVLLPFYKLLENNFVLAQTGQLPLKFVGFGFFHGTAQRFWARQPGDTSTSFSLTYPESPFTPFDDATTYGRSFKDRIDIFEGFDFGVGEYDQSGASMHVPMHGAMGLLMTGSCKGTNGLLNASIDQYLAAKYGNDTRFRSLQIRGFDQFAFPLESGWCLSFDTGGTPLAPLETPLQLWDKVFAGAIVGTDPAAQAAAARKRAIGASVLDFVVKDIQRLNGRLAGAEKEKLDQHLTVVRGLEKRLNDIQVSAQCSPPARPVPASSGYIEDKFTPGNIVPTWQLQMDMLAEAVVCDLTRFATFLMPNDLGPVPDGRTVTSRWTGQNIQVEDGTQDWALPLYHNIHDDGAHRLQDGSSDDALFSQRIVAGINRMYFMRIAKFMQRLDEAGILDSTVVFAGSDGGQGSAHSTVQVPMILAGGTNGKVKLGKRIVAPARTPQVQDYCEGATLTSHNPVLVAIANLFGENLESYGTCGHTEFTQGISSLLG